MTFTSFELTCTRRLTNKHVNNIAKLWKGMGLPHGVLEERVKHIKDEVMATMLRLECEVLREKEKLDEELVSAASKVVALSGELEVDEMDVRKQISLFLEFFDIHKIMLFSYPSFNSFSPFNKIRFHGSSAR